MPARRRLTPTSFAVLGHLGLRPWSAYELTASVRRSLRWFWPSAESRIYEQAQILTELGLASDRTDRGGGRRRTIYALTPAGRRALRGWLRTPTKPPDLSFEGLLRVHLARYGTKEDLLRILSETRAHMEELLAVGDEVAEAFVAGTHPLQDEANVRGLVFDFLESWARTTLEWVERTEAEVGTWPDVRRGRGDRGVELMREYLKKRGRADQTARR